MNRLTEALAFAALLVLTTVLLLAAVAYVTGHLT